MTSFRCRTIDVVPQINLHCILINVRCYVDLHQQKTGSRDQGYGDWEMIWHASCIFHHLPRFKTPVISSNRQPQTGGVGIRVSASA